MKEEIEKLLAHVSELNCKTAKEVEEAHVRLLGKKGEITRLFDEFRTYGPELKKEFGRKINELKQAAQAKIDEMKEQTASEGASDGPKEDLSMPGVPFELGSRHPVSIVRQEIVDIFRKFGYDVAEGPEIEDDYHVFEALNFPLNHPARDMQDTFFVSAGHPDPLLLRTHTSSVQVRAMETMKLPIRVICPGRVFRNEAISARAHCIFHQVEGLYIGENVTFADLKQAILLFAREMFGPDTQIRMRPSYFPFTEPSSEIDVSCNICHGKGCNICKGTGWLEIMGCGMVDPNVLEASGIDSKKYSGFAFGMGLERIAMLNESEVQTAVYQHDMRHHLNAIDGFLAAGKPQQAEEYIRKVRSDIERITPKRYCDNELVNLLCSSFAGKAQRMGVRLEVDAKLPRELSVSDTELCAVLSNALENALRAVSDQPEADRWVTLYCGVRLGKLLVEIQNPCAEGLVMRDGLPVSERAGHGYGCRSIQTIAERRGGLCEFRARGGIFSMHLVLLVKAAAKTQD